MSGSGVRPRREGGLGRGVEDVAQPLDGDARPGENPLPDLGEPEDRLRHPARQHVEGDQLADGHLPAYDGSRAKKQDGGRDQLAYELYALTCPVAEIGDAEARLHVSGELLFPAPLHLRLYGKRFEGLDAGDALHEKGLVLRPAIELLIQHPAEERCREGGDEDVEREGEHHKQESATASRRP